MQSFSELALSAPLMRAIEDMGYTQPSPIQAETIPLLLAEETDFLGLAATGTGKTAAFSIPMLEKLDSSDRNVQTLILCPTRELALQVAGQVDLLGKHKGVRSVAVYGGASYTDQIRGLKSGANVVVGTPGRVIDHLERGTLKLDNLKLVILDEADEMISMGFKDELEKILSSTPRESSNIWLFSATMSKEVRKVADDYLRAPKQVQVNRKEMLPSSVEQYYYPTLESNKPEVLCKLIEAAEDFYGLIFCQTKALVSDLSAHLIEKGYKVDSLHGDKDQNARERTMQSFRDRKVRILVCTDVAARGLDVKDITHVINYSLPRELDNYVHRIGRTARSGKTGIAMNLVTASHRRLIWQIENMTKTKMLEGKIPTRREIGAKKVGKLLPTFNEQTFHTRAIEVMSDEWKTQLAGMSAEEVAARFLSMMMPDVFVDRESNQSAPRVDRRMDRSMDRRDDGGFERRDRADRPSRGFRDDRGPRSFRNDRPAREDRPFREERPFAGGQEERPYREERSFERPSRPERSFDGGDRPFRRERSFDRPARAERPFDGGDRPFRRERPEQGDRPVRSFRPERPPREARAFGGERPLRAERPFGARRDDRVVSEKPFVPKAVEFNVSGDSGAPVLNRKARRALKFAHLTGEEFARKSGTSGDQTHA